MWLSLLANKWVQRAGAVALLALALFWIYRAGVSSGVKTGEANTEQRVAEASKQQVQDTRQPTVTELNVITQQVNLLSQQISSTHQLVLALGAQRQQEQQRVSGLNAEQVQEEINKVLGKAPGTTDFTIDDKRRALGCFNDLPKCNEQLKVQSEEVDKQKEKTGKALDLYTGLRLYTIELDKNYVELWNDKAQAKRKWYCAYLCKTRPKMKQPDPKDFPIPKVEAN